MGTFIASVFKWVPVIIAAVTAVEQVADAAKGKAKQDAAIKMVGELLPLVESTVPREIVNEVAVQDAMRKVIDAVVALQNAIKEILAKKP